MSILKERKKIFAWSYANIPRLDHNFVVHNLGIKEDVKPIKQKLRKIHTKIALMVNKELQKILEVKFIHHIDYFDFRDLNKAYPKDDFPLPNIDRLVDSTTKHEILFLMDGFLGYN